jgi:hypothetical protein
MNLARPHAGPIRAHELPVPPFALADRQVSSDEGKKAVRLFRALQDATAVIARCDQSYEEARATIPAAEAELNAEIMRSAIDGKQNASTEAKLMRKLENAQLAASSELFVRRRNEAVRVQRDAHVQWSAFVALEVSTLLEELRPDAETAAEELNVALEAVHPFGQRYQEVRGEVDALTSVAAGNNRDSRQRWAPPAFAWSASGTAPAPMPSAEVVEEHDRRRHPERYPSQPEPDVTPPSGDPFWSL